VGVTGTPAFFINGRFLNGAKPKEEFTKIVKDEIAYADKLIAKGTQQARVYAEIMKNAKASVSAVAGKEKGAGEKRPGAPDPNVVYKVPVGNSPYRGAKDAKVTIVEWSDFQ
jgi:protein-disulfide isomerase